jgi:hypothetical protein
MTRRVATGSGGAVTAELATGLVAVVLALSAVLGVAVVGQGQLRCVDAARAGARAAARGETDAAVRELARRLAGAGAAAAVSRTGDLVTVSVRRPVAVPLPGTPRLVVRASAAVPVEAAGAGP